MDCFTGKHLQILLLFLLFLFITCYWLIEDNHYMPRINYKRFYSLYNVSQIIKIFQQTTTAGVTSRSNSTNGTYSNSTVITTVMTMANRTIITTSTSTTIDPAEFIVERPPSFTQNYSNLSNATLAVFVFHTRHAVLANLQLFLIRKLATNLIAVELFLDGPASEEMRQVASIHRAGLHSCPTHMHGKTSGSSERNADVVNWALTTKAKDYLRNGTAVLLLDGDVFPLSRFDSVTLLNSHDIVCRKHPAAFSRYCWIGFICLAPQLYSTIDDFNVSPMIRNGHGYDAGGRTVEYLLKYEKTSFSWMKETILIENNKELFWGAVDDDVTWIQTHFNLCNKCGPEMFYSAFNSSDAVFYHMISGTSEWRFRSQVGRRQSLYDSIMQSPYGLNQTNEFNQELSISQLNTSVRKIQKMRLVPYHGNLTCDRVCYE